MQTPSDSIDWPATKRKLVDAGVALMRTRGFNATSLDDICQAAGVTKGGLFHYFKNKDEIAKAALARFVSEKAQVLADAPFRKLEDPLDRVFGRLDFIVEMARGARLGKGCLIGMLAQELSFTNAELRDACRASFGHISQDFEKDLTLAKARYAPRMNFDPKRLATLYETIFQGSVILAKTTENSSVIVDNIEQFRDYVEFLFGKTGKVAASRGSKISTSASN
jgi:TetR/AcrR family transcriptional regulator, transcriptional repressor for nem operon